MQRVNDKLKADYGTSFVEFAEFAQKAANAPKSIRHGPELFHTHDTKRAGPGNRGPEGGAPVIHTYTPPTELKHKLRRTLALHKGLRQCAASSARILEPASLALSRLSPPCTRRFSGALGQATTSQVCPVNRYWKDKEMELKRPRAGVRVVARLGLSAPPRSPASIPRSPPGAPYAPRSLAPTVTVTVLLVRRQTLRPSPCKNRNQRAGDPRHHTY